MYSNSTALDGSEEIPDGWECTAAVQRETAKAVFGVSLDRDLDVECGNTGKYTRGQKER